jgi:hypothetical protein
MCKGRKQCQITKKKNKRCVEDRDEGVGMVKTQPIGDKEVYHQQLKNNKE